MIASIITGSVNPIFAAETTVNPLIAEMIGQVQPKVVSTYTGGLTGEWPVLVNGQPYQILTRSTGAGVSIQKAVQYVYEQMQSSGLQVSMTEWTVGSLSGKNVIGELVGDRLPGEILLLTAHLDNTPWAGYAPGADDNASGCVAVLMAAHILSQYRFSRTIRFAFFTGEEEGLLGSRAYAAALASAQEMVTAVLNMDMIGWNATPNPIMRLHTRAMGLPETIEDARVASQFIQTVEDYGLGGQISPVLDPDGTSNSDHASFWEVSYPAIMVSEDSEDDFNRYYHSVNDRVTALSLPYFTGIVKAVVGTAAQLAGLQGRAEGHEAARLEPPIDQQWARPGEQVVYSLHLTNTSTAVETYKIGVSGNRWAINLPMETIFLEPEARVDIPLSIAIPSHVISGTPDFVSVFVFSQNTGRLLDTTTLTTIIEWEKVYLPVVSH